MPIPFSRRSFLFATAAAVGPAARALSLSSGSSLISLLDEGQHSPTTPLPDWKEKGVIDLTKSPYARLKTVPVSAVVIGQGFWSQRRTANVESSIPSMHDELIAHGRMDNFLRLQGKSSSPQKGPVFSDSDIYKWTEAVGFALQSGDNPQLRETSSKMIAEVVAVQEPSGYLDTYFVGPLAEKRMLPEIQETGHEMYNLGHMLQGAIAYYRATGDPTLLKAGIRFVDGFVLPDYGPGSNQKPIVSGHPEIEMSLIELYRTTGNRKYVELAGYILHGDERIPLTAQQVTYMFCGVPFTSRTRLEGHAVRAMYACCGATDYYLETGDPEYWKTLNVLWDDLVAHQMYVTGGVGARATGEAFGDAYELPNARAYGESCAAIGNMMWNWRMLAASGEARFTDVMECALYNGINSGMSLDGRTYCYRNPLAFDPTGDSRDRHLVGGKIRNPWYDTTCCPPNLERTFASLPGYFYSTSADGVYVHFYDNSEVKWHLQDGTAFSIRQVTRYPWEGDVSLTVNPMEAKVFTVFVRIPGWSQKNAVHVNGVAVEGAVPGEYLALRRRWAQGDKIHLSFDMSTQLLRANQSVAEDLGRVAFRRGPIVFCMESLDQPGHAGDSNLSLFSTQLQGETKAVWRPELLDGVVVLEHPGDLNLNAERSLYFPTTRAVTKSSATSLYFIPYYAWANRAPAGMQVWVPFIQT